METINSTAQELIRELPNILLQTGNKRIDYLASSALADIVQDLQNGKVDRPGPIVDKLSELHDSVTEWFTERARKPPVAGSTQRLLDLIEKFRAEAADQQTSSLR